MVEQFQECPHKSAAVHLFQSRVVLMSDCRRYFKWHQWNIKRKNCHRTGDFYIMGRKGNLDYTSACILRVSFSDLISFLIIIKFPRLIIGETLLKNLDGTTLGLPALTL